MTDFDPTTTAEPPRPSRRRRRKALLIPVAVVFAGGAWAGSQLLRDQPTSDATNAGDPDPSGDTSQETVEPLRMVLPEPPDGYEVQWIQDPADVRREDVGVQDNNQVILLTKPDATYTTGGWIAITTRMMDRFERPRYDPANDGQMQAPKAFALGTMKAAVGKMWDGVDALSFGPVNDGFAVNVSGLDLSQASLTEIAGLISVDDDGKATIREAPLLAGYTPLGVFDRVWGLQAVIDGSDPMATMSVNYGIPNTDSWIGVTNFASKSQDALAVARFFLKSPVEGTVHGQPAIAGDIASLQPVGGQPARVTWVEDGRLVALNANMPADELLALAETTRLATDDEWAALKELWQQKQNSGQMAPTTETWLVAAGELEDSTTWVAEGGFNDDGGWLYAVSTMSARGSMMMGGAFNPASEVEYPAILPYPSPNEGGLKAGKVAVIMALVEAASSEGTVLRFTPDGGGSVVEAPLHKIRDDWPAWSAALAFLADVGGTAELIDRDGTVIRSETIAVEEPPDGGDNADVPSGTAAASG